MSVLKVNNVSIRYMTGDFKDIGLKEYVMRKATKNYKVSEFWADRHVSFTLEKGDMLGIIGTNGAGKSTLLKVVSGIMEPSEGSVQRDGSVAALLELASGFDGDLTVKENTYLRGAMLGYTKKFMDDTYDQIIEFAELQDFQDRPFKQLSSGMKSRLAFSIASLVKPDILILDEVLSVGDGAFRKKSEDKMREIIEGGATTILVSHSLGQIRELCNKVLWLHKGEQIAYGENVEEICDQYQKFLDGGMKPEILPKRPLQAVRQSPNTDTAPDANKSKRPENNNEQMETKEQKAKKYGAVLLTSAVVLLLTALIEWFYFGFQNVGLSVPFTYSGDGIGGLLNTKQLITGDSILKGFPYFQDLSAYQAQTGMLCTLFIKLCGIFSKNEVLVYNLSMFVVPLFNVFVCFWVLRHFKVRTWLAYLAALTFGFCPYVQFRFVGHNALGAVECIPLVIMMCMWCMEDPAFERPGRDWFRYRRNWLALFFAWMIANNGMVYYPFFSCFVLLVTALCLLLRERRLKAVTAPCLLIVQVAGWLAVGFIPTVIGMLKGYGNVAANGVGRSLGAATIYMLRINSLLLSPKGYGIGKIKEVIDSFTDFAVSRDSFYNENAYAYMGIAAIIGFGILLICLFYTGNKQENDGQLVERLGFLSKITVAILILSVSTGLGTLVNVLVRYIRCYNRISPFLVFCGVFALAMCMEAWMRRVAECTEGVAKYLLVVVVLAVLGYGLFEQQGIYDRFFTGYGERIETAYETDEQFVEEIEKAIGEDAMIFQLPYMKAFENGPVRSVPDYDHNRGIIHSDTLRWSYGGIIGGENDQWYKTTAQLRPQEMVDELYAQGFGGIWLNLNAYEAEAGAELEANLCAAARCDEPILCGDGHTVFIPLSQELYYVEDNRTGEIREIHYAAREENIRTILEELSGDVASVRWLENTLVQKGTDGGMYTISLPEKGAHQLHRKTPEEKGELVAVATVVDVDNMSLKISGDVQIATELLSIKNETVYKIELELPKDVNPKAASEMVVDFYAGSKYDRPEQQVRSFYEEGRTNYLFYFDSGDVGGETLDGTVRVFSYDISEIISSVKLRVTQMEQVKIKQDGEKEL